MSHFNGVSSITSTKRPAITTQTNSAAIVVAVIATLVRCRRGSSVCLSSAIDMWSWDTKLTQPSANARPRSMILASRPVITPSSAATPVSRNTGASAS